MKKRDGWLLTKTLSSDDFTEKAAKKALDAARNNNPKRVEAMSLLGEWRAR